jgi:PKD repeat protein
MSSVRNRTIFLLLLTLFFCTIQPVQAADYAALKSAYIASHPGQSIIPFPWEPMSSVSVLPFNYNIAAAPANTLSLTACPNEFESASFIISSQKALSGITITVPTLYNAQGDSIPASAINARTVKVWYQANVGDIWYDTPGKYLVPELLLKDDRLVKVDYATQTNYLKVTINGVEQYIDISSPSATVPASAKITDASTLQPFAMAANENKQIWLTVKVPSKTPSGDYKGDIIITAPSEVPVIMNFTVTVLPFTLASAPLEYGLYYRGRIPDTPQAGINSEYKTTTQYLLELRNMRDHGVSYPTLFQEAHSVYFETALQLRNQSGLPKDHIYIANAIHASTDSSSAFLTQLTTNLKNEQAVVKKYGFNKVYVYAIDETRGATLNLERPSMTAIRNAGSGVFISGYTDLVDYVGDLVSVAIIPHALNTALAARWHSYGNKIFSYANPQAGVEDAGMYRKNYGYVLWNSGYDGEMTYAYQHSFGDIWNDYDYPNNRDHLFTYPTSNGVIDTIEWEGFREAVDDTRYLATLIKKEGSDATARSIVSSSLSAGNDMQTIRNKLIARIPASTPSAPVAGFTGTPVSGTSPLKVIFTDASTNTPTSWTWSFGDGSSVNATARNPVHTYSRVGTYTVALTATNAVGSNTITRTGYVTVTAAKVPVASFTGTPVSGTSPLKVIFTDASTNTPTSWNWSFGDGSSVNATARNPVHTYSAPGKYTVALTVKNAAGSNVTTRTGYVTVTAAKAPVAKFTGTPISGTSPLKVIFTDASTNTPTSWDWSFGDGSRVNATARNPVHTYSAPGKYTVALTVKNAAGSNVTTRTGYITVTATAKIPVAKFTGTPRSGTAPLRVTFTDTSTNAPTAWKWSYSSLNLLPPNTANGTEDGTTGTSWLKNNRGTETILSSTDYAWEGTHSLKIIADAAYEGAYTGNAPVIPSNRYTFSVYARGAVGGEKVDINIEERDGAQHTIGRTSRSYTLTTEWRRLRVSRLFGATGVYGLGSINIPSAQSSTYYIDGAQLELGSVITPWQNPIALHQPVSFSTSQNPKYTFAVPGNYTVFLEASNSAGNNKTSGLYWVNVSSAR